MQDISYKISENIAPAKLSAVIGADSFFYGVFDKDYQLISCKYFESVDFSKAFRQDLLAELAPYSELDTTISFTTKPYLHLGEKDKKLANYYPAYNDKKLSIEKFTAQEVYVMYGLKPAQLKFIKKCFGEQVKIHHFSTVMQNAHYPYVGEKIYLHVDGKILHFFSASNEKLLYYNQFQSESKEDYLYYTLMVYEVLGFDAQSVPLLISGRLEEESAIYKLMHGYIQNISFVESLQFKLPASQSDHKQHYYHDLYSTAICG